MDIKGKKVLVTGGAGFIGSHLVDALVKKNCQVTVIDNLKSGHLKNLSQSKNKIVFKKLDLRKKGWERLMGKVDVIFHFAANADVPYSVDHPDYDFQTNVLGTYNLLAWARKKSVKRFVFASSAAVYGKINTVPITEEHLLSPISPYGASKLAGEKLGLAYFETYGFPFVALRIFNTYGPRQSKYVMYDLLKKIEKNNKTLEVLGTKDVIRDYLYVKDMVEATIKIAEADKAVGKYFNIAGGQPTKINDLVRLILENLNLKGKIKVYYTGKSWPGDIKILSADIKKLKKEIKFQPKISLEEGLRELINWFQNR